MQSNIPHNSTEWKKQAAELKAADGHVKPKRVPPCVGHEVENQKEEAKTVALPMDWLTKPNGLAEMQDRVTRNLFEVRYNPYKPDHPTTPRVV